VNLHEDLSTGSRCRETSDVLVQELMECAGEQ